jgi:hypothetical protein
MLSFGLWSGVRIQRVSFAVGPTGGRRTAGPSALLCARSTRVRVGLPESKVLFLST